MKIIQTYKILKNKNVSFAGVQNDNNGIDPNHWLWTHYSMRPYLRSIASELTSGRLDKDSSIYGAIKHGMFMGFPRYEQSLWTDKVLRHPRAIMTDKAVKLLGRPLTAHEKRTLDHFTTGFNGWTNSMGKQDAMLDMGVSGAMLLPLSAPALGKTAVLAGKSLSKVSPAQLKNAAKATKNWLNSGTKASKALKATGAVAGSTAAIGTEFVTDAVIQDAIERGINLFQYDSKEFQDLLEKTKNDPRLLSLLYNEAGRLNQGKGHTTMEESYHIMGNRGRNLDEDVFYSLFNGLDKNTRKYDPIALSQQGRDFWDSYMASGKKTPSSFLPGEEYTDYYRRRTGTDDRGWMKIKDTERFFPDYYKGEGNQFMRLLPHFKDYQTARQAFDNLPEADKKILQGRISEGWDETNELLIRDFGRHDLNLNEDGSLSWGKNGWFSKSSPVDLSSLNETQLQTLLYNLQGRNYMDNKKMKDQFVKETGTQRKKETKTLPVSNIATRRDIIEPQQTVSYEVEDKDWVDSYTKWASSNSPWVKQVKRELDTRFPVKTEKKEAYTPKHVGEVDNNTDPLKVSSTIKEGEKVTLPNDVKSTEDVTSVKK